MVIKLSFNSKSMNRNDIVKMECLVSEKPLCPFVTTFEALSG